MVLVSLFAINYGVVLCQAGHHGRLLSRVWVSYYPHNFLFSCPVLALNYGTHL